MRTRVTVLVAFSACMLAACNLLTGISNLNFDETGDGGSGGADSSTITTSDSAAPAGDGGTDTGLPAMTPDSSTPSAPTLLVSGTTLALEGVTDDGYFIYGDTTTSTLYAIASSATASTTPTTLGTADLKAVSVLHDAVVFYGTSTTNRVGPLYVWESALTTGAVEVATQSLESEFSTVPTETTVAVSADSTHLLYYDDVNAAGTTGTLYMYSVSGKQQLVGPIDVARDACLPRLRFSAPYALASYCTVSGSGGTVPEDAGAAIATISSWNTESASPAAVTVATNVQPAFGAIEKGAPSILGFNENSLYAAAAAGGGTPVTLDENAESFFLVSPGTAAVYTTSAEALRRTPTAMAGYTTLVGSGFSSLKELSPNGNWIVGYKTKAASGTSDLYAASTTTAGTPTTLTTATTAAIGSGGDAFTADSTYALYQAGYSGGLGTATATALSSGGAPRTIASANYATWAVSGTVIVFNANYASGAAQIQTVDVASPASPVTLATGTDPYFVITYAKDKIAYTVQGSGLYVMAAPGAAAPPTATCNDAGLPAYKPVPSGTSTSCTATGISTFYADCLDPTTSTDALCSSATETIGTSCYDCLLGVQGNSTVWGALVATTDDVFVNVGGCYLANVGSSAQSCASNYQAYTLCVSTACGDVSDGGVTNCVEAAAATGGQCSCQLSAANSACAPFASSPCASTTDDFEMLFTTTATAMCQ